MTQADATLVGSLLEDRYRVTGLLARGGMATVYRGVDTRLDRTVAIKLMHPQFAADPAFTQRFEREARAAAQLHHPHVVAIFDQGVDRSSDQRLAFLVMELVNGGTLRDLLDTRGALDISLAVSIAAPVFSALAAAHEADFVHRDMKPENVLLGPAHHAGSAGTQGAVKVADFGLVRAIASAGTTSSGLILGTVAYLSPEQVTTGTATARSDVYSLGVLLFEMLTGRVPYTGETALSVAYRHVNENVPAPSSMNTELCQRVDDLVLRATQRDPDARQANAGALLTELEQVRRELGIGTAAVPAVPPPESVEGAAATTGGSDGTDADTLPMAHADSAGPQGTRAFAAEAHTAEPHTAEARSAETRTATSAQEAREGQQQHPGRRGRRAALVGVLAVLALALLGGAAWWFTAGQSTTVPDVAGMDQANAESRLNEAGLDPAVIQQRHNTEDAGAAIGTEPAAGTELRTGDSVDLVVSLGRPTVPDIRPGTGREEAETAIAEVDLEPRLDAEANQYHESIEEGAVVGVSPEPGTSLDLGEPVTLILSRGPPPDPVPDVTGRSRDEAFSQLRDEGFEPYEAGEEFDGETPGGDVVRTDPDQGATPEGDTPRVGVYVSNAVEVPTVTGRNVDSAESILDEHGLSAETDGGTGSGFSFVVSQDPDAGEFIEPAGTVTLTAFP